MEPSRFDELTKALATATSRRQALRRIAGMLGGTVLAGLFPGLALADNSACAHFCADVFGADTPAAGQCTSDAAHHKGLCYSCGPASPGGTKPICCPENSSGYCTNYSSAICCTSGQTCQNGQCVNPTTTTTTTTTTKPPGLGCTAGSQCESACPDTSTPFCVCGKTMAGAPVCYLQQNGCNGPYCANDADCGPGNACVNLNDGCGGCDLLSGGKGVCNPICTS